MENQQQIRKQKLMRGGSFLVRLLLATGITVLLALGSAELISHLPESAKEYLFPVAPATAAFLVVLLVVNIVMVSRMSRRLNAMNVARMQEEMLARKEQAEENLPLAYRRLRRVRRQLVFWESLSVILSLLAIASAMVDFSAHQWCLWVGFVFFTGALFRIRIPQKRGIDPEFILPPADFPALYGLCNRAKEAVGVEGSVKIGSDGDCGAGIWRDGKDLCLVLGAVLLDVLTEEELYQILLHEFSHLRKEVNLHRTELALADGMQAARENFPGLLGIFYGFFTTLNAYSGTVFVYELTLYRVMSSTVTEAAADRAVLTHGNPAAFAGALAKTCFYDWFDGERRGKNFFAEESYPTDFVLRLNESYKKALQERGDFWREKAAVEIQPRNASHPIFRNRIGAVGVTDYTLDLPDDEGTPYRKDCHAAIRFHQNLRIQKESADYAKTREEFYLQPLKTVTDWEAEGRPLYAPNIRGVLNAMRQVGRPEEAEALADALIASEVPGAPVVHAHYIKGLSLLERYDPAGIEYLYRAADTNFNYQEECLEVIGTFCCRNGLAEELERYRERAVMAHQKARDERRDAPPSLRDTYLPEHLPEEVLESILAYVEEIDNGSVEKLYLVRRKVSADFAYSTFIIEYKEGASPEQGDEFYDRLFEHLDTRTEDINFYLMNASAMTKTIVKRVENAQVYPKEARSEEIGETEEKDEG